MTKSDLRAMVEEFPDEQIDPERVIRALYVRAKLERAERAVEEGRLVSHEEVAKRSRAWSK